MRSRHLGPALLVGVALGCGSGSDIPPGGYVPEGGAPIGNPPVSQDGGAGDSGTGQPNDGGGPGAPDASDGAASSTALQITASATNFVPKAGDPSVVVQVTQADGGGTTSLRFSSNKTTQDNPYPTNAPNNNHIAGPSQRTVQMRDRDLGQSFVTGGQGFQLDTVYLQIGPSDQAVLPGAPGAKIVLQLFKIMGYPALNDSGTPGFLSNGGTPVFDRSKSPQLDDFLEGETYIPIATATGTLPATLAAGDYLALKLTGQPVSLLAHWSYAFLVGFVDRAPDRAMSLANAYFGSYRPDNVNGYAAHAIRREGGTGATQAPFFQPDLPDDLATRLAQAPGTLGFPDVDTFRDLFFTVTGVPGSFTP